jgi:hypothetical protein
MIATAATRSGRIGRGRVSTAEVSSVSVTSPAPAPGRRWR